MNEIKRYNLLLTHSFKIADNFKQRFAFFPHNLQDLGVVG